MRQLCIDRWEIYSYVLLLSSIALTFDLSLASEVYKYNICNGLSNQLLYHSASIALAIQQHKDVQIPDYFIVNGAQTTNANILPSISNSVPLKNAFDVRHLIQSIQTLGTRATLVDFDFEQDQLPCAGMEALHKADSALVLKVLKAFRPSPRLQTIINSITNNTVHRLKPDNGLCLHHRDGEDWHLHCQRWASIQDGVYRGNCLGVPNRSFMGSLQDRGLSSAKWVYYCGDDQIPPDLVQLRVYRHNDFMSYNDTLHVNNMKPDAFVRDLWALIDFFVCNQLHWFVGNSVSTFSAIQIALRNSENSYWYNSQSIPLAHIWRSFHIPIVYTYTEMSSHIGKLLLQTSIASMRRHIPESTIHILYHGHEDHLFRNWLRDQNVIIHQHDPSWKANIETMRLSGDPATSHLFQHEGNYFGTWQRIDIPLFIDAEYCLLLDSDTLVLRPFTLADFGLNTTYGIAMSAEVVADSKPWNAGIMLMNIPKLRQTHEQFLRFIQTHTHNVTFKSSAPSDQGAYLEFYEADVRFLDREFNFKPYWDNSVVRKDPFILHFHGAKPHDYIKFVMGLSCDKAVSFLCVQVWRLPFVCRALQVFAIESQLLDPMAYCQASFHKESDAVFCNLILDTLAKKSDYCYNLGSSILSVLNKIPVDLGLPKEKIASEIRKAQMLRNLYSMRLFLPCVVAVFFALLWCSRQFLIRRSHRIKWKKVHVK